MPKDIVLVDPYSLSDEEIKNYVGNYKIINGVLYDSNGNTITDDEELRRYETARKIHLMAVMTVGTAILENKPRNDIDSYLGVARDQLIIVSHSLNWPINDRAR